MERNIFRKIAIITVNLLIFAVLSVQPAALHAQQELLTTQWSYNKLTVNAAYAGGKDVFSARALHRQQWVGVNGRPVTTVINVHSPLLSNRMGLGLSYAHDKLGVVNTHYVSLAYAYRLPFENDTRLSFGINAGIESFSIQTTELEAVHPTDPLLAADLDRINPKVGAGIYYYGSNFYVGVSSPNLIPNRLYKEGDINLSNALNGVSEQVVHLYGMAGYAFEMANDNVVLKPQVLFKAATSRERSAPFQADFNISMILFQRLVLGGTARTTIQNKNGIDLENAASADVMMGFYITENWFVSYAYDFTLGELKNYDSGSHEIMIGFDMDLRKNGVFSPRYF